MNRFDQILAKAEAESDKRYVAEVRRLLDEFIAERKRFETNADAEKNSWLQERDAWRGQKEVERESLRQDRAKLEADRDAFVQERPTLNAERQKRLDHLAKMP